MGVRRWGRLAVVTLGLALIGRGLPAVAQESGLETVQAGEAAPAQGESFDFDLSTSLSIRDEISLDLIDLGALREAMDTGLDRAVVRLSLDACIARALESNQDILLSSYQPAISEADVQSAKGEFDPVLRNEAVYTYSRQSASQQTFAFGGVSAFETYATRTNSSLSGKLSLGTQYSLDFTANKEETTFGNFIEEFDGFVTLTLTQPLLRGFGPDVNLARIRIARNSVEISQADLELTVMNTVAEVVKAYWDLVGAVENLRVRQASLDNAERLLQVNTTRNEIGMAADIEVLQAKAGVATRQSDLISARAQVDDAADLLKALMDLRDGMLFSKAQIVPVDRPNISDFEPFDPSGMDARLEESLSRALANRPEVVMADLQIENAELEELRARNDMRPQLDVTGSYGQGGRDHKLREMLEGVRSGDDESYSYGVIASIPLGNRSARGAYRRAKLTRQETEQRKQLTLQQLMLGVHQALRNVNTNHILVESNRQARRLQEANVVAEEKQLKLGMTTAFEVLQIQEDLTSAQTQEVQSHIAYEKALVDLMLSEGSLLEALGVEFSAPEMEPAPGYFDSLRPRWK